METSEPRCSYIFWILNKTRRPLADSGISLGKISVQCLWMLF